MKSTGPEEDPAMDGEVSSPNACHSVCPTACPATPPLVTVSQPRILTFFLAGPRRHTGCDLCPAGPMDPLPGIPRHLPEAHGPLREPSIHMTLNDTKPAEAGPGSTREPF